MSEENERFHRKVLFLVCYMEGRADAVPTTRYYTPDSPGLDERRGQPLRSAKARSRPGGTAYMITVIPQRQVSLMAGEFHGPSWTKKSGHVST